MQKSGISLRKRKEPEFCSPEVEQAQLKMSLEIADISVQVPTSELKFHTSVPLLGGEGGVENPKEKEITLKVE